MPSNIKRISNTKRGLLSALCSVSDPLGFATPCLIEPKPIIQEFWQINIEWDQNLPADLEDRVNKLNFPDTAELTYQLKNQSYTFLLTHCQRLTVVLLTSESSKTIKQKFHLSFVKVN